MCYTRFCAVINMIISTIGVLLGLLIFIACLFYYSKYNAALWGLFSAVFSAGCLHLQRLRYQRKLNTWYTTKQLESLQSFGLFFFLVSVVACGVYLSLAIVRHQDFSLKGVSFFPAAAACGLNLIWSLRLFLVGYYYQRELLAEFPSLCSVEQVNPSLLTFGFMEN